MSFKGTGNQKDLTSSLKEWSDWKEAKKLYEQQRYDDAIQELRAHSKEDASYYYNLGTLYYWTKKPAPALAHLEKANYLLPHDPDIQYNLSRIREQVGQIIGTEQLDPASTS